MLYDVVEIKAIMIALGNIESIGEKSKEILLKSIVWLRKYYERSLDRGFLEKAVWHAYAYLNLGFPYEEIEKEIQKIVAYLGTDIQEVFPEKQWKYRKMKLTKTNVRNLIGRWNPKLHSMNITDVVEDIIQNVREKRVGEYLYYSGKRIEQEGEKTLWEQTYKLYVNQDEAILHALNKNVYYMFV